MHGRGPGADDANALVRQVDHGGAIRVPAGVLIVPPAGVKVVTGEGLDAGNTGQLRPVQGPRSHGDETCANLVAAIGRNDPSRNRVIPGELRDLGRKQRIVVESKVGSHPFGVGKNFRCKHVFGRRHMPGLFQQWKINHRRGVTHRTRISVPVPRTAHVAAAFNHAHVVDPRLLQTGARR